ncbi:ribosome maturation factor RimM [Alicyclobacillus shizuokensis]|uniref:ribosome maturation factor RimM n=1 Tax=Alicyclobacillus shizuokensis TaxID=392014 RepID=UPI000836702D|nr:ribosome maturation factor RimM [Alicyclobacillus shizuokensis]MCL6625823.1 ribosome maturation factor RimM [Alicyclobacillus shizuokensis]
MELEYLTVGVIANTHGLRGELRVLPRTDFPEQRFAQGVSLWLRPGGQTPIKQLVVRSARPHKQFWLVLFEGVASIGDVEAWKGMELCVPVSERMPLPEESYYIDQLIGLQVYSDDGAYVGELVDVLTPGANDVYVVRGPLQRQDVLLPAIRDCVREVDLASGRMVVHLLPGLLEEESDGAAARRGEQE